MIILTHRFGRLGNRLLITAHLMAYALETGHTLMDWGFAEYAPYFVGTAPDPYVFRFPARQDIWNHIPVNQQWLRNTIYTGVRAVRKLVNFYPSLKSQIQVIPEPGKHWGNPLLIDDLMIKKALFIRGWYVRAPRCFTKYQDVIRACFTPLPCYQQKITEFFAPLRDQYDVIVGLHIRAGDYRLYGGFHGLELWRTAMEQMVNHLPGKQVGFLIFSDENFCDQINVFTGFSVHFGLGHILEDLYTLAQCDYIIAPPSTYSNWAAFYGQVPICQVGYVKLHTNQPICEDMEASRDQMEQSMRALNLEQFRRITYFVDHRIDP
ncbi:MAG: alpha-1,2-fucosyltransferase [Gloeomargarita sp. DG02_3_bins_56]